MLKCGVILEHVEDLLLNLVLLQELVVSLVVVWLLLGNLFHEVVRDALKVEDCVLITDLTIKRDSDVLALITEH